MFQDNWIASRLLVFIPLLLSLSVHEWAHAFAAWMLGDDTARLQGRMSVNPIVHMDPVGTLILPILGVPFGWAKPVPFEPVRFRRSVNMRLGTVIVAAAGPFSNLCIALVSALALALMTSQPGLAASHKPLMSLLQTLVGLNVLLALFNLLPIPPLDGSHVASFLMPEILRPAWNAISSAGPLLLIAVIVVPQIVGISLLAIPQEWVSELLSRIASLSPHGPA
jgi:Zn-dependent protease